MRLSSENDHYRTLLIEYDSAQPVEILKQQRRSLVRSEAAGKAECQNAWINRINRSEQPIQVRFGTVITRILCGKASAYAIKHLRLQSLPNTPEQVVRDGADTRPIFGITHIVAPLIAEIPVKQVGPFLSEKCWHMHSICDVAHRIFLRLYLRPQFPGNTRGHFAVYLAHAIVET